jgi:hypothetical protein
VAAVAVLYVFIDIDYFGVSPFWIATVVAFVFSVETCLFASLRVIAYRGPACRDDSIYLANGFSMYQG